MGSAPSPDPKMGEAALLSAKTGKQMMTWMRGQADITNNWASEDRNLYKSFYQPLEKAYVADAQAANNPNRMARRASAEARGAIADVRQQFGVQRAADRRGMTAMGVNPRSRRFLEANKAGGTAEALAVAGAANVARRASLQQDEARADGMTANAINLGKGLAVNPGESMGLSNSAGSVGFNGAMQGYNQQANILNQDYQNRMQAWQSNMGGLSGLASGLGAIAGAASGGGGFLSILSSKDYKTDKKPAKGSLEKVRKMPVEEWAYKPGIADGGAMRHIGPYAEDFSKATGVGDGKSIDVISQLGVTLGAVQELDKKVAKLEKAKAA